MLKLQSFASFCQKPRFVLILILVVFFLKGLFFVAILPIFQGPDEAIHYATIQYFAEPREKNWLKFWPKKMHDGSNIETYNFSEELQETAKISKFDEIKSHSINISSFSNISTGLQENEIETQVWKKFIDNYPPTIVSGATLYYTITSVIEKFLSQENILVRFFSIRIGSVLLGMMIILLAYLTSLKIGLNKKHSLLFSAIIAFQPMFTQTAAIINYDIPLIFSFSLFTYTATALIRDGFHWKFTILLFFAAIIGALTKGPGMALIVLVFPIAAYIIYKKFNLDKKFIPYLLLAFIVLAMLFLTVGPRSITGVFTNFSASPEFSSPLDSLQKYASTTVNRWGFFELTYWGSFGWLDHRISSSILHIIWVIEIIALVGLIYGLFFRKEPSDFLPEKKYIIFFILILLALQAVIRFYDWRSFYATGRIETGTPGRYFLPNIIAHFIVLFYGLGIFFQKRKYFDILLSFSLVVMVGLFMYSLINIIIPRYYL